MMETMTTGELAERAGVNTETVRYYERRGLLPEPPRNASGYRQYSAEDAARIHFIKRAQQLGFALEEVETLLALRADPEAHTRGAVKRKTQEKIEEVESKIRDLQRIKSTLEELASACDGAGTASECPILQAFEGEAAYHGAL